MNDSSMAKLQRFFDATKTARKRLRTAIDFVRHAAPDEVHAFFVDNCSHIFTVAMAAVHDYERLGTIGQSNLTIQKRHVYDKLTSKFKNKVIIVEDWIDIFDLVDGLLLHCSEILQTGWQKDGLTDFFTKLVHPENRHVIRRHGLRLLLRFTDSTRFVTFEDNVHLQLLAEVAVDYHPFSKDKDQEQRPSKAFHFSSAVEALRLPKSQDSQQDRSAAALQHTAREHSLELLHQVLNYATRTSDALVAWSGGDDQADVPLVAGQGRHRSTTSPDLQIEQHFRFWWILLLHLPTVIPMLYPRVCKEVGLLQSASQVGFTACPLIFQRSLWQWLGGCCRNPTTKRVLWERADSRAVVREVMRQRFQLVLAVEKGARTEEVRGHGFAAGTARVARVRTATSDKLGGKLSGAGASSTAADLQYDEGELISSIIDDTVELYIEWTTKETARPPGMNAADERQHWFRSFLQHTTPLFKAVSHEHKMHDELSAESVAGALKVSYQSRSHLALRAIELADCITKQQLDSSTWQVLRDWFLGTVDSQFFWHQETLSPSRDLAPLPSSISNMSLVVQPFCRVLISCWLRCNDAKRFEGSVWAQLSTAIERWLVGDVGCNDNAITSDENAKVVANSRRHDLCITLLRCWQEMLVKRTEILIAAIKNGDEKGSSSDSSGNSAEALLLCDRTLHLVPPQVMMQMWSKLREASLSVILDIVKLWCKEAHIEKTQRASENGVEVVRVNKISPATLLAMFGPWLYSPLCNTSRQQRDDSHDFSRALGLEALCRICSLRTPVDAPLNQWHTSRFCFLVQRGLEQLPHLTESHAPVIPVTVSTLLVQMWQIFGADLPGINRLIPPFLKAVTLLFKHQRRNLLAPSHSDALCAAVAGVNSLLALPNRYKALGQRWLPSLGAQDKSKETQHSSGLQLQTTLSALLINQINGLPPAVPAQQKPSKQQQEQQLAWSELQSRAVWGLYTMVVDQLMSKTQHLCGDHDGDVCVVRWVHVLCSSCSHPSQVVASTGLTVLGFLSDLANYFQTSSRSNVCLRDGTSSLSTESLPVDFGNLPSYIISSLARLCSHYLYHLHHHHIYSRPPPLPQFRTQQPPAEPYEGSIELGVKELSGRLSLILDTIKSWSIATKLSTASMFTTETRAVSTLDDAAKQIRKQVFEALEEASEGRLREGRWKRRIRVQARKREKDRMHLRANKGKVRSSNLIDNRRKTKAELMSQYEIDSTREKPAVDGTDDNDTKTETGANADSEAESALVTVAQEAEDVMSHLLEHLLSQTSFAMGQKEQPDHCLHLFHPNSHRLFTFSGEGEADDAVFGQMNFKPRTNWGRVQVRDSTGYHCWRIRAVDECTRDIKPDIQPQSDPGKENKPAKSETTHTTIDAADTTDVQSPVAAPSANKKNQSKFAQSTLNEESTNQLNARAELLLVETERLSAAVSTQERQYINALVEMGVDEDTGNTNIDKVQRECHRGEKSSRLPVYDVANKSIPKGLHPYAAAYCAWQQATAALNIVKDAVAKAQKREQEEKENAQKRGEVSSQDDDRLVQLLNRLPQLLPVATSKTSEEDESHEHALGIEMQRSEKSDIISTTAAPSNKSNSNSKSNSLLGQRSADLIGKSALVSGRDLTLTNLGGDFTCDAYAKAAALPIAPQTSIHAVESGQLPSKLERVLHDATVCAHFRAFLEREFASESLDFWCDVQAYRRLPPWLRTAEAKRIHTMYTSANSERQVNLKSAQFARLRENIEVPDDAEGDHTVPVDVFDEAEEEVLKMLRKDNFARYLRQPRAKVCPTLTFHSDLESVEKAMWRQEAADAKLLGEEHLQNSKNLSNQASKFPFYFGVNSLDSCRLFMGQLGLLPPTAVGVNELRLAKEKDSSKLLRSLKNLDRCQPRETIKVALVFVGEGQRTQADILRNSSKPTAVEYEQFVNKLGWEVDLEAHGEQGLFSGGLDTNSGTLTNGRQSVYFASEAVELMFHVVTKMPTKSGPNAEQQIDKKRHVGNDFVHIVWCEHHGGYQHGTITSKFTWVTIIIQPLRRTGNSALYRVNVHAREDLPTFGPLLDGMLVGADALPLLVRQTAVAANRCCRKQVLGAGYMQPYQTRKKLILDELVGRYSVQYQDGELLSRFLRQDGDDRAALRAREKRTDAETAKAKVARTSRLTLNSKRSMSAGSVAESLSRFTAESSVAEF